MDAAAAPAELSEKRLLGESSPSPLGADEEASTQAAREEGWAQKEAARPLGGGALGEEEEEDSTKAACCQKRPLAGTHVNVTGAAHATNMRGGAWKKYDVLRQCSVPSA